MPLPTKFSLTALIAGGLLMASAAAALAAPAEATSNTTLRDDSSYQAAVVDTVDDGDELDVENCTLNWCYVDHYGTEGWIRKSTFALTTNGSARHRAIEPDAGYGRDYAPDDGPVDGPDDNVSIGFGFSTY